MIGTTEEMIKREESVLNKRLPISFKNWLLKNNGTGIGGISIFPVKDENNIKKTWESISSYFTQQWASDIAVFEDEDGMDFSHLLPFGYGNADYYCFDYSENDTDPSIVIWFHENGETEYRAANFIEFEQKALQEDYDND